MCRPNTTNQQIHGDCGSGGELEDITLRTRVDSRVQINLGRHSLGRMDIKCPNCSALHWIDEKLVKSSMANPRFGACCLQGKINMSLLKTPPPQLQQLYDGVSVQSKSFRRYTREYNAANAFTSLGIKMDPRVIRGRGPTSFTIHGELRHRT